VSNKGIKKDKVTDGGQEAAMKAGVVAPNRGVRVNGNDGGDELGDEEYDQGDVKRSFFDDYPGVNNHLDYPGASNDGGEKIDGEHFVKLEQFVVIGGENQGDENK